MSPVDFGSLGYQEIWSKGGPRYLRVGNELMAALGARPLDDFCICFAGRVTGLSAYSPFAFFRREYAIARSGQDVLIFRLGRPAYLGSRLQDLEAEVKAASLSWTGEGLALGSRDFTPLPNHREAAQVISSPGAQER